MFSDLLKKSNRNNNIFRPIDYNYEGNTVLHECVFWDSNDCILYLIKHFDFNKLKDLKNKDGNTALHLLCLKGNTVFINEFYKLGANISEINNKKETLLHCAVKSGDLNTVKHVFNIFDNVESLNCRNDMMRTPLHVAVLCKNKNINVIKFLVESGQLVNKDYYNNSIMKNLERLEHNILEIKTFLTKSFYDAYKDKQEDENNYTSMASFDNSKINDDTYISNSFCKVISDFYKKMLCEHPEYKPYVSINNKNGEEEHTNDVNIFNVVYDKESEAINEPNNLPVKVLPYKYKKLYNSDKNKKNKPYVSDKIEHFQNIEIDKNTKNYEKEAYIIIFVLFLIIFIFFFKN